MEDKGNDAKPRHRQPARRLRHYTTFCVAHALLNDGQDADGPKERIVCACEVDGNGALTMQLLQHLSLGDQPSVFADVRYLDRSENVLWLSNCGSQSTDCALCPSEISWMPHGFAEHKFKLGGVCPQYVSRPGRVTLARLSRIQGRYVMMITGGTILSYPRQKLKETFWEFSPHAFVELECSPESFLSQVRSNHLHWVYGEYGAELEEVAAILGVEARRI
jgi:L-fucose isomerase